MTDKQTSGLVYHVPVWSPAQLQYNAAGDTKPGFVCTHELENGNGQCMGNVFELDQAIGDHCCMVESPHEFAYVIERPKFDAGHLVAVVCSCGYTTPAGPLDWCKKQWGNHKRDKDAA